MNRSPIKSQIEDILKSHPFVPSRFTKSTLAQFATFFLTRSFVCDVPKTERKLIQLPDGSKLIATCWFQSQKHRPAVIILNGIEGFVGEGKTRFGRDLGYKAYANGYNVIFLRQRGEAEGLYFTNAIADFHCEDLPIALSEIHTWGISRMYVVGRSLGGWVAMLSLGKIQHTLPGYIKGLIAISAPASTIATWRHIEKHAYYNRFLLKRYKGLVQRRIAIDPPGTWDTKKLKLVRTKRQFFETYKHDFGYPERFGSIDEYLQATDVIPYLKTLSLPMLIIHAKDDPITPAASFNVPEVQQNPNIISLFTDNGSHGFFISGKKQYGDRDKHWAQNRTIEFIHLLEKIHN